ncbi:hypothetical protein V5O48_017207, partial [Marasmius crinis-equi]
MATWMDQAFEQDFNKAVGPGDEFRDAQLYGYNKSSDAPMLLYHNGPKALKEFSASVPPACEYYDPENLVEIQRSLTDILNDPEQRQGLYQRRDQDAQAWLDLLQV